ncbi:hypothetical protein [Moritella sp. 36]|nr:hypothetical protein [Moritella sp. 36]
MIQEAGMYVDQDTDDLGLGHTLLACKKKSSNKTKIDFVSERQRK